VIGRKKKVKRKELLEIERVQILKLFLLIPFSASWNSLQ